MLVYYNFSRHNLYQLHSPIPTNQPLVDMVLTKLPLILQTSGLTSCRCLRPSGLCR